MRLLVPMLVVGACLALGCEGRKSSAGFRLPDGDPEQGRAVFAAMKCHACHTVNGMPDAFPAPVAQPVVPVSLGGEVPHARTDGELVTSIIHPSHQLAPAYATLVRAKGGERERMPDYGEVMSVSELIDLVAFLQSRYEVVRPGVEPIH